MPKRIPRPDELPLEPIIESLAPSFARVAAVGVRILSGGQRPQKLSDHPTPPGGHLGGRPRVDTDREGTPQILGATVHRPQVARSRAVILPAVQAPLATAVETRPSARLGRPELVHLRIGISSEASWLWAAVLVFIGVSFWWLTQDNRIPIWDAGNHMEIAYIDSQSLAHGHISAPFTAWFSYPPLLHLVGAVSILLVGMHPMSLVMTANLVFVPLLAFGCYGVGKLVAGPRAGLLAGLFGLGTPMFVSMMHDFYIDTPQAAMVAVSLWAILASRRFERLGVSVLAGALCGLALLTKETSAVFLAGALAALVLRGGWRHPVGLLGFAAALAAIAAPWYVYHWHEITQSFTQVGQLYVNPVQSPPRWSLSDFGWYFWNLLNQQALVPFTVAFFVGIVIALRRCVQLRLSSSSLLPELLAGALVSYLVMTYLNHKDPRYTLPGLVYVAVLGTFWIAQIRGVRLRRVLVSALVAVAIINFVGMSTGLGGTRRVAVSLPGAQTNMIYPGQLTLYENEGWLRGGPQHDVDVRGLLEGFRRLGITTISFDPSANDPDFSLLGIAPLATELGVGITPAPTQAPNSVYLVLHPPQPGYPAPCGRLDDGNGVYAVGGPLAGFSDAVLRDPKDPRRQYLFVCPGRGAVVWPQS